MSSSRRILAIESSGQACSAALGDGASVLRKASLPGALQHAAGLIPLIDQLCKAQHWLAESLDEVYVSIGPGSFTGLRIGVSVARTLAWSTGAKVVAVPTMQVLAQNALDCPAPPTSLAVLLDAKRGQVYAAAFELSAGAYRPVAEAQLTDPAAFLKRCSAPVAVLGEGVAHHTTAIEAAGATTLDKALWSGQAEAVLSLGCTLAGQGADTQPGDLLPCYIRKPEAEEKWEQRHLRT